VGKISLRRVDGGLNLLFRHIDILIEIKLQRDDRTANELVEVIWAEAGHLAKLPFQRCRD